MLRPEHLILTRPDQILHGYIHARLSHKIAAIAIGCGRHIEVPVKSLGKLADFPQTAFTADCLDG